MKRDIFSEWVEGFESLAKERQQHISVARELAPAGLRSSPNPGEAGVSGKQQLPEVLAPASPERRPAGGRAGGRAGASSLATGDQCFYEVLARPLRELADWLK